MNILENKKDEFNRKNYDSEYKPSKRGWKFSWFTEWPSSLIKGAEVESNMWEYIILNFHLNTKKNGEDIELETKLQVLFL